MKVTDHFLEKWDACPEACEWIAEKGTRVLSELYEAAKVEDHLDWVNWYLARKLPKMKRIQYAIYAAEPVLPIFEAEHPDDPRPRQAIEAAKKYLKTPSRKNAAAAAANAITCRGKTMIQILDYGFGLLGLETGE